MGLIRRLFGPRDDDGASVLYAAIVARGRAPHWYLDGGVADTMDGRFDMIAAVLSLVLIRIERDEGEAAFGVLLTERFITDMDAQLRQQGVGDVGLGKQVGQMVGMLGGRLTAYRDRLAAGDLAPALVRNLYRGKAPTPGALAHVSNALDMLARQLAATPVAALKAGTLP